MIYIYRYYHNLNLKQKKNKRDALKAISRDSASNYVTFEHNMDALDIIRLASKLPT